MTNLDERLEKIEEFLDSLVDYDEVLNFFNKVVSPELEDGFHYVSRKLLGDDIFFECTLYKFTQNDSPISAEDSYIGYNGQYIEITVTNPYYDKLFKSNLVLSNDEQIERPFSPNTTLEELEIILFEMRVQYGDLYNDVILLMVYVLYKKYMNIIPNGFDITFYITKNVYSKNRNLDDVLGKFK